MARIRKWSVIYFEFELLMKVKAYILILLVVLTSCSKLDFEREDKVTGATELSSGTIIVVESDIIDIYDNINDYGHCWSSNQFPTVNDEHTSNGSSSERISYIDTLEGLLFDMKYYVRSFVTSGNRITYGDEIMIQTPKTGVVIENIESEFVTETTFVLKSEISNIGSMKIMEFGHCFAESEYPTINYSITNFAQTQIDTTFEAKVSGLSIATDYYIRPYAKLTEDIIVYGGIVHIYIPDLLVLTNGYLITGSNSATIYGEVAQMGILDVESHGFCWSYLTSNPNINNDRINLGTIDHEDEFEYPLTGLIQNIDYYYRAYAVENNIITYGEVKSFKID